jgi:hypothetical protein
LVGGVYAVPEKAVRERITTWKNIEVLETLDAPTFLKFMDARPRRDIDRGRAWRRTFACCGSQVVMTFTQS